MIMEDIIDEVSKRVAKMTREEILSAKVDTRLPTVNERENTTRQLSSTQLKKYVHRHHILMDRRFKLSDPNARNSMAYHHPYWRRYIKGMTKQLNFDKIRIIDPETKDDEEPKERKQIMNWFKEERIGKAIGKCRNKCLTHGYILFQPIRQKYAKWYSGPQWFVRAADELEVLGYKHGHPVNWHVRPSNQELEDYPLNINQCLFHDQSESDDFKGEPIFVGLWDDSIQELFIDDAHQAFLHRVGHGFLIMVVPNATTEGDWNYYEDSVQNMRVKGGMIVRGDVEEPITIDWLKVDGKGDIFEKFFERFDKKFALHTQVPKRLLFGDQEGAMESSGKDRDKAQAALKDEFEEWIPLIKKILLYYGKIPNTKSVEILPNFDMDKSDTERLEDENLKTDMISKKAWLTDDEKRELDGFPPMTEEQKAEKMAMMMPQEDPNDPNKDPKDKDKPEKEDKPKPEKAKVEKKDTLDDLKNLLSTMNKTDIAKALSLSKNSVKKLLGSLDNQTTPHIRHSTIKTDSMRIEGRMVTFDDCTLLGPKRDETYYEGATIVLTDTELKQWFNTVGPREFHLGVTPMDDHPGTDVYLDDSVGVIRVERIDEFGYLKGSATFDLDRVERILGKDNWVEKMVDAGGNPPISVGRWSKNRLEDEDTYQEYDVDIRSWVLTRQPRNQDTALA